MLKDVKEKIAKFFGGMVKLAIIADLHSVVPESYSGTSTNTNIGSSTRTLPEGVAEIFNISKKVTNI